VHEQVMPSDPSQITWIGQRMPVSHRFAHVVFARSIAGRAAVRGSLAGDGLAARRDVAPLTLDRHAIDFLDWLFSRTGLDWRMYRAETLQRRLASCLRTLRVRSLTEARWLIERESWRADDALGALLIGVTSFFRDAKVFEELSGSVLPQLFAQRGGLYAWSMGCSDGAELYTLGMLVDERGWLAKSYLLGTDCRESALRAAKTANFDPSAVKQVAPDRLARYFEANQGRWQLCRKLRQSVRWRQANLLASLEPGLWDLIMFRNTAIYLRGETTDRLWQQIEGALRPGGVLMVGKAERPTGARRLAPIGPCLYQRLWR
jgi:chemotaxis protein methyltransferase CheR